MEVEMEVTQKTTFFCHVGCLLIGKRGQENQIWILIEWSRPLEVSFLIFDLIAGGQNGGHLVIYNMCHVGCLFIGKRSQENQIWIPIERFRPLEVVFECVTSLVEVNMEATQKTPICVMVDVFLCV